MGYGCPHNDVIEDLAIMSDYMQHDLSITYCISNVSRPDVANVSTLHAMFQILNSIQLSQYNFIVIGLIQPICPECKSSRHSNALRLPSGEHLTLIDLRMWILSQCDNNAEIVLLIDGCDVKFLELPYHLDVSAGCYTLNNNRNLHMTVPCMLALGCCDILGVNQPTYIQSVITLLRQNINSLSIIVNKLWSEHRINCDVQSSYPIAPVLWSWMFDPTFDIYINEIMMAVMIRRTVMKEENH